MPIHARPPLLFVVWEGLEQGTVAESVGEVHWLWTPADLGVNYSLCLWEGDITSKCFPSYSLKLRQKEIAVNAMHMLRKG